MPTKIWKLTLADQALEEVAIQYKLGWQAIQILAYVWHLKKGEKPHFIQLAKDLKIHPTTVYYHVRRFKKEGFLTSKLSTKYYSKKRKEKSV